MAKRVDSPTGQRPEKKDPKKSKKCQGIKPYAVDIVFSTGQRRNQGTFMHPKRALKRWRKLIAECSLADQVLITNRRMSISVKQRGMIGHC